MTSIGYSAFSEYTRLKSVTIPKTVTYIGHVAFGYNQYQYEDDYYYDEEDNYYYLPTEGFTIYGIKGFYAETYAKENDFTFIAKVFSAEKRFHNRNHRHSRRADNPERCCLRRQG